eukprot:8975920-Pyramimonas_sp.AAC.2
MPQRAHRKLPFTSSLNHISTMSGPTLGQVITDRDILFGAAQVLPNNTIIARVSSLAPAFDAGASKSPLS